MHRIWRSISIAGVWTLFMAIGLAANAFGGDSSGKSQQAQSKARHADKVAASTRHTPRISRATFSRVSRGRVAVRFRVHYPQAGRSGHDTATARLEVVHPRRKHALVRADTRRTRVARVAKYHFVVHGDAARILRRAGAGRATAGPGYRRLAKLVTLSVVHARDLWRGRRAGHRRGRGTDHLVGAVSSGLGSKGHDRVEKAARDKHSKLGAPRGGLLGGVESAIHVENQTGEKVEFSVAGFQCVYDHSYDATLRTYNNRVVSPGEVISPVVTQRASGSVNPSADAPVGDIHDHESPEVRSFLTQYSNMYAGGYSVTPLYGLTIANLGVGTNGDGNKPDCGAEKTANAFILGITGSDSRLHAEVLLTIHEDHNHPGCGGLPKGAACFQAVGPIDPGGAGVGAVADLSQLNQPSGAHSVALRRAPFPSGSNDPAVPALANGNCQPWNWMTCVFRPGKSDEVRLFDVLWPGTHDSGTYALSAYDDYQDYDDETDCAAPDIVVELISPQATQRWAVTQRFTLRQQLEMGIRYLDLRAAWNDNLSDWSIVHTMFSPSHLSRDLSDVAQWARAHPDEVVFVNLGACRPSGANPHQTALESSVRDSGMCGATYPDAPSGILGNATLAKVRASKTASGHAGNVILLGTGAHGISGGTDPGPPWTPGFVNSCHIDVNSHARSLINVGPGAGFPGPSDTDADDFGCVDFEDALGAAATMANTAHDPNNDSHYTIENYKSANNPHGVSLIVTPTQWSLLGAYESFNVMTATGCPHSLLDFGRVLLPDSPLRPDLDRTGLIYGYQCGNIITADNFTQSYGAYGSDNAFVIDNRYVKQIIALNQARSCPVDVFLHVSATLPAHSRLTFQLPSGIAVDPVVPITQTGGVTISTSPDHASFTVANNTDQTVTAGGNVVPVTATKGWPSSITITVPYTGLGGTSIEISAGNGPVQHSDGGAGQIQLPAIVPGPGT